MAPRKTPAPDPQPEKDTDAPEPVLKTSLLAPVRPTVDIDDKLYELRQMRDFGIAKQQELNREGRVFGQLWNSEKRLTDDQQKRLKMLLERLFKTVLIVPDGDDLLDRMADAPHGGDDVKADVVLHFILAPLRKMMADAMAAPAQTETTDDEEPDDS